MFLIFKMFFFVYLLIIAYCGQVIRKPFCYSCTQGACVVGGLYRIKPLNTEKNNLGFSVTDTVPEICRFLVVYTS